MADTQEETKKSIFGAKPAAAGNVQELVGEVNNIARSLKSIEDKLNNLRNKTQLIDQNLLSANKKFSDEIKISEADVMEIKREVEDMREKMKLVVRELKLCAKYDEVKVLEKYIEMWNPINFVTRDEVERIVQDAIDKRWHTIE
jgi:tetrahydromethanopterin S-methyltransferase subunit F